MSSKRHTQSYAIARFPIPAHLNKPNRLLKLINEFIASKYVCIEIYDAHNEYANIESMYASMFKTISIKSYRSKCRVLFECGHVYLLRAQSL